MFERASVLFSIIGVGLVAGAGVSLLLELLGDPPVVVTGAVTGILTALLAGFIASRPPPRW